LKKIYIDTNIIIAYAVGPTKEKIQYPKAEKIFKQIEDGEFIGVVSTLTLTEIIGVLRTLIGREREKMLTIKEHDQNEHVRHEAKKIYDEIIKILLTMNNIKFEEGKMSNFQTILSDGFELISGSTGFQKFHSTCGICRQAYKSSNYKQILVADILHALLAKDTGCDELLTFDGGFRGIIGHEKIEPLTICVK